MKKAILVFIILSTYTFSQELNCNVIVNYQNLPVKNRDLLVDFTGVVEDYMNNTRFTDLNWDGDKIDCTLNIFFTSASGDLDYSAQIVVVSQRPVYQSTRNSAMLTINDAAWSFQYQVGQSMYHSLDTFDPLASLLDYYALIIIGFDMDTWEEYGGSPFYSAAFNLVNLANSSGSKIGWEASTSAYSRWGLVADLTNEKYSAFRSSIFDYHYGIDIFQQNSQIGQAKIAGLVNVLYDMYEREGLIKSVFVKTFFDAKYGEITDHLEGFSDVSVFTKLKKVDPPHAGRYDQYIP
ncbi:DUF4835 family protein [Bacteroidota bacterium]